MSEWFLVLWLFEVVSRGRGEKQVLRARWVLLA